MQTELLSFLLKEAIELNDDEVTFQVSLPVIMMTIIMKMKRRIDSFKIANANDICVANLKVLRSVEHYCHRKKHRELLKQR